MIEAVRELFSPELAFLRNAILLGILAGPVLGVIGSMVVTRRISSLAGASAHTALGGVGIALFLQRVAGISWCSGNLGAVCGAVFAALLVGAVSIYAKEREDTVIAVVWALGMAVGLLFLDKTPGYVDWQGYLFGSIPLFCGNENLDSWCPVVFFSDQVTVDGVYSKLEALADREKSKIENLRIVNDNDVLFEAYYLKVPWLVIYKKVCFSANLVKKEAVK